MHIGLETVNMKRKKKKKNCLFMASGLHKKKLNTKLQKSGLENQTQMCKSTTNL